MAGPERDPQCSDLDDVRLLRRRFWPWSPLWVPRHAPADWAETSRVGSLHARTRALLAVAFESLSSFVAIFWANSSRLELGRLRPKLPRFRPRLRDVGRVSVWFLPCVGRICPRWGEFDRTSSTADCRLGSTHLSEFSGPDLRNNSAILWTACRDQCWATLGRTRPEFDRIRPKSAKFQPTLTKLASHLANAIFGLGRPWPKSANIGPNSASLGQLLVIRHGSAAPVSNPVDSSYAPHRDLWSARQVFASGPGYRVVDPCGSGQPSRFSAPWSNLTLRAPPAHADMRRCA